jgi:hypothetical protein
MLWSMISGEPRLQLWYHHKDQFELEKIFPDKTDIRWARMILDECIVEEEKDCLANAGELLKLVDEVLQAINRHAQIVSDDVVRTCNVCGLGKYQELRRDSLTIGQTFRMFHCSYCGHSELFYAVPGISLPSWAKQKRLPVAPTQQSSPPPKFDAVAIRERLQEVDLSVRIFSGHAANLVLEITNHSDELLRITRIRLENSAIELSRPAEPPTNDAWSLKPRQTAHVSWHADPDPASGLIKRNSTVGTDILAEVDFLIRVELHGITRQITKRIMVRVNAMAPSLIHVVG